MPPVMDVMEDIKRMVDDPTSILYTETVRLKETVLPLSLALVNSRLNPTPTPHPSPDPKSSTKPYRVDPHAEHLVHQFP